MSKHTPGPWMVDGTEIRGEAQHASQRICDMAPGFSDEDARLIAAAPDLLEALQALTKLYDTDEGCRALPEYLAARAAIAKATGGTE